MDRCPQPWVGNGNTRWDAGQGSGRRGSGRSGEPQHCKIHYKKCFFQDKSFGTSALTTEAETLFMAPHQRSKCRLSKLETRARRVKYPPAFLKKGEKGRLVSKYAEDGGAGCGGCVHRARFRTTLADRNSATSGRYGKLDRDQPSREDVVTNAALRESQEVRSSNCPREVQSLLPAPPTHDIYTHLTFGNHLSGVVLTVDC